MSSIAEQQVTPKEATPPAAKGSMGTILAAAVISTLLALAVVAGGVFWLLHTGMLGAGSSAEKSGQPESAAALPSHVLALEPIIVNLSGDDGHSYLRAEISLRIADEPPAKGAKPETKEAKALSTKDSAAIAVLRDATLQVLSQQTPDALLSTTGKQQLKQHLQAAYASADKGTHVLDVYFTDFLVQRG